MVGMRRSDRTIQGQIAKFAFGHLDFIQASCLTMTYLFIS